MYTTKLILSILFLFLGIIYLYRTDTVMKINLYARQFVFNDTFALLYRKKLGVVFIILSLILMYMAGVSLIPK
jgi:hypothetical protein